MHIAIEPAKAEDLAGILALLAASGLPQEGLGEHLPAAIVARSGQRVVGSAALELYGKAALLRSVVVSEAWRGRGLGRQLTMSTLELARRHGVTVVYLLTMAAAPFFARLGFRPIARSAVDPAVQRSIEFTSACPATAQAMMLDLTMAPALHSD